MPEYIFTNLPQYIRITPRTDFTNSVVQANHVLLFSEDGATLTGKLPDGTFITVGDGTDVSDTTATAATVLSGYDFYNSSGVKTSGSIPTVNAYVSGNVVTVPVGYIAIQRTITVGTSVAAQTITPGTTDQTIAAGSYLTGAATIKGDANLIASNIADGVTIFGVTGTASSGSADFYKCKKVYSTSTVYGYAVSGAGYPQNCNGTYIDTGELFNGQPLYSMNNGEYTFYMFYYFGWWCIASNPSSISIEDPMAGAMYYTRNGTTGEWSTGNRGYNPAPTVAEVMGTNTWTGYKAVLSGGAYSFESTVTSGLTYGSGFTPEVGKVYNDEALIRAELWDAIPTTDGLVLYIPFSSSSAVAETGQLLDFVGSGFSYQTVNGIPCCNFSGAGCVDVNLGGTDGMPTGNFTISYWVKFTGSEWGIIYTQLGLDTSVDSTSLSFGNYTEWGVGATTNTANWHHFAVTRENDTIKVYLDGSLANSGTQSLYVSSSPCRIGAHITYSDAYPFVGYLAGLRVYSRALSAAEITALAAEFTPSVGS